MAPNSKMVPHARAVYFKSSFFFCISPGIILPSSTGPDDYITEPSSPQVDISEYEQSGDLPFTDDEDYPYSHPDEHVPNRGPGGQAGDWPGVVLTEEAKSSALGRSGVGALLVLTVLCCTDVVW